MAATQLPTEVHETNCYARQLLSGCFTSQFVPRRPSGIPEEDIRSAMVPYLLKHRSYLRKILKEKEEENRKVAESVLAGRNRVGELQQLIQARKQAWQVKIKKKQIKPPSLSLQHQPERNTILCFDTGYPI